MENQVLEQPRVHHMWPRHDINKVFYNQKIKFIKQAQNQFKFLIIIFSGLLSPLIT